MISLEKYPVLGHNYVVRQTKCGDRYTTLSEDSDRRTEYILYNWVEGAIYDLTTTQLEILRLADGTNTALDIINHPNLEQVNRNSIKEFLGHQLANNTLEQRPLPLEQPRTDIKELQDTTVSENIRLIQWEITSNCNLSCLHCYNDDYLGGYDLDTVTCKRIICQLDSYNPLFMQISGGEPLTRPDLFDILHYIEEKKITISYFFSNALLLDQEAVDNINSLNSDLLFLFSCDGFDERSYEFIRGKNTFPRFLKSIEYLKGLRKDTAANIMLHKGNHKNPDKMLDFLIETIPSIKRFRIGTFMRNGQGRYGQNSDLIGISMSEELDAYKRILTYYYGNHLQDNYQLELSRIFQSRILSRGILKYSPNNHPCSYVGGLTFTIKPEGTVQFCPALFQHNLGNIKTSKIGSILRKAEFREFMNLCIKEIARCTECRFRRICGGGCRALTYPDMYRQDNTACEAMDYLEKEILPVLPTEVSQAILSGIDN